MDWQDQMLLKRPNMQMAEDRISKLHDNLLHHILALLPTNRVVATSVLSRRWRYVWTSVLGNDRITRLPNTVLHYILSFLPTKHAIATSILSTRWRHLWTSLPNLDIKYDRGDIPPNPVLGRKFMNFMDRVLKVHMLSNLRKFSLECDQDCDGSRVNQWITTITSHKIPELNLAIYIKQPSVLPDCLFTCKSLKVLILLKDGLIKLPSFISFSSLKTLHLLLLIFSNDYLTEKLFSSCPVLEELNIETCSWVQLNKFSISARTLKCLTIDNYEFMALTDGLNKCIIEINAPNLEFFFWRSEYLPKEFILCDLPSLDAADITIERCDQRRPQEEVGYCVSKLLGALSGVKVLNISSKVFKILSIADDILPSLPTFNNLIHLEISTIFRSLAKRSLFHLLQISPYLETLVFAEGSKPYQDNEDDWVLNAVSHCLLLHLNEVEIREFDGYPMELHAASFFLRNATVLKKMTISTTSQLSEDQNEMMEVAEQLSLLPRTSVNCVVDLL